MKYQEIALSDNHPQATFDYVVRVYGLDVAENFLVVHHEVWRLLLAGFTEEQTQEMIGALFNIFPLGESA